MQKRNIARRRQQPALAVIAAEALALLGETLPSNAREAKIAVQRVQRHLRQLLPSRSDGISVGAIRDAVRRLASGRSAKKDDSGRQPVLIVNGTVPKLSQFLGQPLRLSKTTARVIRLLWDAAGRQVSHAKIARVINFTYQRLAREYACEIRRVLKRGACALQAEQRSAAVNWIRDFAPSRDRRLRLGVPPSDIVFV